MPTYEYACTDCDNHWEEVQKISEPALDTYPKCQKKTAQRQISGGSFILKGGGWYADLYSSSKPAKKEGEAKSETNGASKAEPKSEAKAEAGAPKKESATPAPAKPAAKPTAKE